MPRNTFVAGEVLTAAEMNSVADQTVMTFAGTAARGSAIASPSEGMVSYLDDSNQLEVYDGSNWVGLAGASVGTATPATTAEGDFWLDTDPSDGQVLKAYNSGWKNVGPLSNNAIINGDFGIWQRGTTFTSVTSAYTADRWRVTGSAATVTRETFTPDDLVAIGFGDAEYFCRYSTTGVADPRLSNNVEDVRTFAGQTVTLSFWAKSSVADALASVNFTQRVPGVSAAVVSAFGGSLTTSWQRVVFTVQLPDLAGETITAGNHLEVRIVPKASTALDLDIWGVQLEAGSVATPFRLAGGGSKAAELALCQRYYQLNTLMGSRYNSTSAFCGSKTAVTMRTIPSLETPPLTDLISTLGSPSQTPTGFSSTFVGTTFYGALFTGLPAGTIGVPVMTRDGISQIAADAEL